MNHNSEFLENFDIVQAFAPVDLQTTTNAGDWVDMRGNERCVFVLHKGIGTAGDDPVITVTQATDNAASGEANLNFTRIKSKVGTQSGIGQWTTTTQSAANTYVDATSAEAEAIIAIEIKASDLTPGYTHIKVAVSDVGSNAQLGSGLYILGPKRYPQATPLSSIG